MGKSQIVKTPVMVRNIYLYNIILHSWLVNPKNHFFCVHEFQLEQYFSEKTWT